MLIRKKNGMKTALFAGRFQPFHRGHAQIVKGLLLQYPQVVIAIGSRKKRRTADNPFSAKERRMLIEKSLSKMKNAKKKEGKRAVRFAYLDDFAKDEDWAKEVGRRFPPEKYVAYSGNKLVLKLLDGEGFDTVPVRLLSRKRWQGKNIRKRIAQGKGWKNDLPKEIHGWMEKKGVKIIKSIE
ncbi:MAG: adenylyltransferase/cytidyltransferase family protein [Candidatus Micrarchaeota archaeon]